MSKEELVEELKAKIAEKLKAAEKGDGHMTVADVAAALKVSRRTVHRKKEWFAEIMGTVGLKFTKQGRETAVAMG
jgi:Mn-dependent DtxR family transcriptional regulator